MGHSIFVVLKNKELYNVIYNKMFNFIIKNYRPFDQIFSNEENDLRGPENDLSYTRRYKKLHYIGFDYNSWISEFQRMYKFRLCCWMALRCSKTRKINGKQMHYMVYDGYEKIYLSTDPTDMGTSGVEVVSQDGFMELRGNRFDRMMDFFTCDLKKFNNEVERELKRLSQLWDQENSEEIKWK